MASWSNYIYSKEEGGINMFRLYLEQRGIVSAYRVQCTWTWIVVSSSSSSSSSSSYSSTSSSSSSSLSSSPPQPSSSSSSSSSPSSYSSRQEQLEHASPLVQERPSLFMKPSLCALPSLKPSIAVSLAFLPLPPLPGTPPVATSTRLTIG